MLACVQLMLARVQLMLARVQFMLASVRLMLARVQLMLASYRSEARCGVLGNGRMLGADANARREVQRFDLDEVRSNSAAGVDGELAAGVKMTARWRIHRRRYVALEDYPLAAGLDLRIGNGHSGDEGLSVRHERIAVDLFAVRELDDAA